MNKVVKKETEQPGRIIDNVHCFWLQLVFKDFTDFIKKVQIQTEFQTDFTVKCNQKFFLSGRFLEVNTGPLDKQNSKTLLITQKFF